jgi:hypothetical protein
MHAHIHMPPNLGFASCGCSLIAGLKEESSSGSRDPAPQGSTEVSMMDQTVLNLVHTQLGGERHKEIKRQKSGHERKARFVLELEER